MSCPCLTLDDEVAGICSVSGRQLSDSKVNGFCETDAYIDCPNFVTTDEEEFDEMESEFWF